MGVYRTNITTDSSGGIESVTLSQIAATNPSTFVGTQTAWDNQDDDEKVAKHGSLVAITGNSTVGDGTSGLYYDNSGELVTLVDTYGKPESISTIEESKMWYYSPQSGWDYTKAYVIRLASKSTVSPGDSFFLDMQDVYNAVSAQYSMTVGSYSFYICGANDDLSIYDSEPSSQLVPAMCNPITMCVGGLSSTSSTVTLANTGIVRIDVNATVYSGYIYGSSVLACNCNHVNIYDDLVDNFLHLEGTATLLSNGTGSINAHVYVTFNSSTSSINKTYTCTLPLGLYSDSFRLTLREVYSTTPNGNNSTTTTGTKYIIFIDKPSHYSSCLVYINSFSYSLTGNGLNGITNTYIQGQSAPINMAIGYAPGTLTTL